MDLDWPQSYLVGIESHRVTPVWYIGCGMAERMAHSTEWLADFRVYGKTFNMRVKPSRIDRIVPRA